MAVRFFAALITLALGCRASPMDAVQLSTTSLTEHMVAHWRCDDGSGSVLADSSGKGHNGTLTSSHESKANWTDGFFGGALHLEQGDWVSVPDFPQATASWSVALWIRANQGDFADQYLTVLSTEHVFVGGWELNMRLGPTETEYAFGYPAPTDADTWHYEHNDCPCVDLGRWTHVVIVVDGQAQTIQFFKNGVLQGSRAVNSVIQPGNATLYFGRWSDEDRLFVGDLDDVVIYDRALLVDEARLLYERPAPDPH
jgi:hypothetical protein